MLRRRGKPKTRGRAVTGNALDDVHRNVVAMLYWVGDEDMPCGMRMLTVDIALQRNGLSSVRMQMFCDTSVRSPHQCGDAYSLFLPNARNS